MTLALCILAEVVEKRFDIPKVGSLCSETINGAQAIAIDNKQNQCALGAAQISREDHEESA